MSKKNKKFIAGGLLCGLLALWALVASLIDSIEQSNLESFIFGLIFAAACVWIGIILLSGTTKKLKVEKVQEITAIIAGGAFVIILLAIIFSNIDTLLLWAKNIFLIIFAIGLTAAGNAWSFLSQLTLTHILLFIVLYLLYTAIKLLDEINSKL